MPRISFLECFIVNKDVYEYPLGCSNCKKNACPDVLKILGVRTEKILSYNYQHKIVAFWIFFSPGKEAFWIIEAVSETFDAVRYFHHQKEKEIDN